MIDPDTKQRIKVVGIFLLQSYKIITGTMVSLFIPQSCGNKMCSIQENYDKSEIYHKTLFYCNSFTMFLFLCTYMVELRREEWCVKYLDINNDYSDNGLKEIIIKDKKLDNYMDRVNKHYYFMVRTTCFFYFINIALTIRMLNSDYHSNSTISCFISFTLLVLMKLYNSYSVAYQSVKNDKMMSAYMNEFVSYNVIDDDYVKEKYGGNKNNRLEDITYLDIETEKNDDDKFKDVNDIEIEEKDKSIKEEEIIPII
jgi:hypothetical protein|tara:strand:+ start:263 stop:1027 length:765 start_codon:yes stop_codon:yes gene_type:complete